MTGDRLRELVQAATPGPRDVDHDGDGWMVVDASEILASKIDNPADARLIALAPDMAVLLADAIDALDLWCEAFPEEVEDEDRELLARFRALGDHT